VVLAVTYGSLVVAGMNLLTAVVGVGIGVLGITIATGFTDLSSTTPILAAMLGLAVGIDYALLHRQPVPARAAAAAPTSAPRSPRLSAPRLRGRHRRAHRRHRAHRPVRRRHPVPDPDGSRRGRDHRRRRPGRPDPGPGRAGLPGMRALPKRQRSAAPTHHAAGRGFLGGWVATVTRHRLVAVLLTVVALGTVAVPFFSMQTTLVQTPPEGSSQARAEQLLADGFGEGFNGPLTVLFEGDGAVQAATAAAGG
jgi:RND superfamily putative drug exporter